MPDIYYKPTGDFFRSYESQEQAESFIEKFPNYEIRSGVVEIQETESHVKEVSLWNKIINYLKQT